MRLQEERSRIIVEEKELSETTPSRGASGDAEAIRAQLERVLAGPSFRTSKRYSRFLRYVVGEALDGRADGIKERVIAAEVFDRKADYDSTIDPIVRVAAGDIRKRIAQYYVQPGHESELRIELTAGSYVPTFQWPDPRLTTAPSGFEQIQTSLPLAAPPPQDQSGTPGMANVVFRRKRRFFLIGFACVLLALAVAAHFAGVRPEASLNAFWNPFLAGSAPSYICLADILTVRGISEPQAETDPTLFSWISDANHVAYGDVVALADISGPFQRFQKPFRVLMADSVNLTDLRGQPLVLIGGLDNPWAVRFLTGLRYTLQRNGANYYEIHDAQAHDPSPWRLSFDSHLRSVTHDYGVITRFANTSIEQPTMIVAGIGPYGTAAAGEFVTRSEYFAEFARAAPKSWAHQNVQIVIQTEVVDGQSGPPHMMAYSVW